MVPKLAALRSRAFGGSRTNHLFALLTKSDRGLLWLNSLFWLASVPFPTPLLGDGAVMMMVGASFSLMRFYALYIGKLTAPDLDRKLLKRTMIKSAPSLHLIAILLAFVNTTTALASTPAIPILFFMPTRLEHYTATKPG